MPVSTSRFAVILMALLLLLPSLQAGADPVKLEDSMGKPIVLESPPSRILSTAPSITEILFSLGLGEKVVGVTNNCNYPPEAGSLPKIGDIHLDMEKIIELKPDLVIVEESLKLEAAASIEKFGFPILTIDCRDMEHFKKSLLILGQALGAKDIAVSLVTDMEDRVAHVKERLPVDGGKVPVFVEIWDKPIITAGGGTFFDDLIGLAGGENIFGGTTSGYPRISLESLIKLDPQVIILTTSKRDEVMTRTAWKGISAVKSGRVYDINPDIIARPTLRMVEAIEIMALWLHPGIRMKDMNFGCGKTYGPAIGKK